MSAVTASRAREFLTALRDDVAYVEAGNTSSDCLGTLRVNRNLTRKYLGLLSAEDRQEADPLLARAGTLLGD